MKAGVQKNGVSEIVSALVLLDYLQCGTQVARSVRGETRVLEQEWWLQPFPLEKLHATAWTALWWMPSPFKKGTLLSSPCFSGLPQLFSLLPCLRKRQEESVSFQPPVLRHTVWRGKGARYLPAAIAVAAKAVAVLPSMSKLTQCFPLDWNCGWKSTNLSS